MATDPTPTRAAMAGKFEDAAAQQIDLLINGPQDVRNPGAIAYVLAAQVQATLALTQRIADLTDKLQGGLGGVEEEIERFRVGLEERPS